MSGRRGLLLALPAAVSLTAMAHRQTIASLDWGISETLFALGLPVIGAADTQGYARALNEPLVPPGTRNLGLWSAPNLELLQALAPDLILMQNWQAPLMPLLRRIAMVKALTIYTRGDDPYDQATSATRWIGTSLGGSAQVERFIADGEAALATARLSLRPVAARPVLVIKLLAGASFMAFGRGSLFQGALDRLGLVNAWTAPAALLAGASITDLPALAAAGTDTWVIVIDSESPAAEQSLYRSQLWAALPFVRARRFTHIPPLWEFGMLPTAHRFAALASAALLQTPRA